MQALKCQKSKLCSLIASHTGSTTFRISKQDFQMLLNTLANFFINTLGWPPPSVDLISFDCTSDEKPYANFVELQPTFLMLITILIVENCTRLQRTFTTIVKNICNKMGIVRFFNFSIVTLVQYCLPVSQLQMFFCLRLPTNTACIFLHVNSLQSLQTPNAFGFEIVLYLQHLILLSFWVFQRDS